MRGFLVSAFFLALLGVPGVSSAASLSISPASGVYFVGDQISFKVLVSSSDAPLNALSGTLSFPSSLFSVQSISKAGSILNFWVTEPTFSVSSAIIQFEGVSLAGFQGTGGTVITVTLRALKVGSGTIAFQSGQALANDGQGTDITAALLGGTFQIQAAKAKPIPTPAVPVAEVKPEAPVAQTLTSPVILLEKRNDISTIVGTSSYPKASALLTFVPVNGSKLFITGMTDEGGNFIFAVPQALRNGPYAVNAVIVVSDGTQSLPSNVLTVEVGDVFIANISWESATYASLFLIILLLTLLGYFISRKHFRSQRNMPAAIKKEVKQAEEVLHKSFALLDQDLSDHLKDRGEDGKADSKERAGVASLKKDLREAEEYIGNEIRDITIKDEKE